MKNKPQEIISTQLIEELIKRIFPILVGNIQAPLQESIMNLNKKIEECRINLTAFYNLLIDEKLFSEEDFFKNLSEAEPSFGRVNSTGILEGKIIATKYNFDSELER